MNATASNTFLVVRAVPDRDHWDALVDEHAGHPLQLWGWGAAKAHSGTWKAVHLEVRDSAADRTIGGAQVLIRRLPLPFARIAYVPRGPFGDADRLGEIATAVAAHVRREIGGVGITFEPDINADVPFEVQGGRAQAGHVLIPSTLILDLRLTPEELLAGMAKKTRQYVHKSQREDLVYRRVRDHDEIAKLLDVYDETARRAGFPLHDRAYYFAVQEQLGEHSPIWAAWQGDEPVAFLWNAVSASTSFELYGGVTEVGQRLRANYALKWTAITDLQQQGVTRYDLNGLLNDGISTFKRGFSKHEDLLHSGVDVPFTWRYSLWTRLLPTANAALRRLRSLAGR